MCIFLLHHIDSRLSLKSMHCHMHIWCFMVEWIPLAGSSSTILTHHPWRSSQKLSCFHWGRICCCLNKSFGQLSKMLSRRLRYYSPKLSPVVLLDDSLRSTDNSRNMVCRINHTRRLRSDCLISFLNYMLPLDSLFLCRFSMSLDPLATTAGAL